MLVDEFVRGAQEAGHTCEVVDVCHAHIYPCTGCVLCGYDGPCVQRDSVEEICEKILSSHMVVFATPLYYFGMSAQLKTLVDRFCAFNGSLTRRHLRSALLSVAWNSKDWVFDALKAHYKMIARYLGFADEGMVLGYGCGTPVDTRRSGYPDKAYRLGRSL